MTKEQKFYKALEDVFIGAKTEGKGGFINLMRIKSNYFSNIENTLKAMTIDNEDEKVKVGLNKLYSNIDIAENPFNLTEKWIKK